jgi:murein DD-endopeptidase MepM/ murein hydrolase activator NlpD
LKLQVLSQSIASALAMLRQHPRRVTGALAALLLGTGVTAFGVAPLAPDAADLPVTEVVEVVQPMAMAQQTDALLAHRFNLYRTEVTRSTDTADSLLSRLGINDAAAAAFLRKDASARNHIFGRSTRTVTAEANDDQQLLKLAMRWPTEDQNFFKRLVIERQGSGFVSRIETDRYSRSSRMAAGPIQKSLNQSVEKAGLGPTLAQQLTEIFGDAMDLSAATRKGDRFSAYYEVLEADGEPLRTGRVLGAELVYGGQALQAMWFRDEGSVKAGKSEGRGAYYSLDGRGLRKNYLAPLVGGRVTSGFAMRLNPVLNRVKPHQGIDYAAPPGTPVRAVGDGVVEFAGWQNGYGNVVFLEHSKGHSTVYAHLNSIAVSRGQKISQGQHLGGVGSTGWATGPHLHFEFRINGVHKDPSTQMARSGGSAPVPSAALPAFRQMASQMRQQLSVAAVLQPAPAQ